MKIEKTFSNGSSYQIDFFDHTYINDIVKIPTYELLVEASKKDDDEIHEILPELKEIIQTFIKENNCLLFIYASKTPIKKKGTHQELTNQQYRSKFYQTSFDKYKRQAAQDNQKFNYITKTIMEEDSEFGDHYITVITTIENASELDKYCRRKEHFKVL